MAKHFILPARLFKHYGPGDHKNGTPQSVHGSVSAATPERPKGKKATYEVGEKIYFNNGNSWEHGTITRVEVVKGNELHKYPASFKRGDRAYEIQQRYGYKYYPMHVWHIGGTMTQDEWDGKS